MKKYDVKNLDDIGVAVVESAGRNFRIYGENRHCYFDLNYNIEENKMFAWEMVNFLKEDPHYLVDLIKTLMEYMSSKNMKYDHVPVCAPEEISFKPFRETMYKMFPNV